MSSITVNQFINIDAQTAYDFIKDLSNLSQWATSFVSDVSIENGVASLKQDDGELKLQFVQQNIFGVLDHVITLPSGAQIYQPMRVLPNAGGSEVILTLLESIDLKGEKLKKEAELMQNDLENLKALLEAKV